MPYNTSAANAQDEKNRVFIRVDLPDIDLNTAGEIYRQIKELVKNVPNADVEMSVMRSR